MDRFDKFLKACRVIGIVALIILGYFLLCGCGSEQKAASDKIYDRLESVSEELGYLQNLYEENKGKSYSHLEDALYEVSVKCDDLQRTVDSVLNDLRGPQFDMKQPSF